VHLPAKRAGARVKKMRRNNDVRRRFEFNGTVEAVSDQEGGNKTRKNAMWRKIMRLYTTFAARFSLFTYFSGYFSIAKAHSN
jgi:hypothetical protein